MNGSRQKDILLVALAPWYMRRRQRRVEYEQWLENQRQRQRRVIAPMFSARDDEGAMEVLVNRHLRKDGARFIQYFRLSFDLFASVLRYIERDITSEPTNIIPQPISPEVKLAVTLRLENSSIYELNVYVTSFLLI